jgi:hypothetical protein
MIEASFHATMPDVRAIVTARALKLLSMGAH